MRTTQDIVLRIRTEYIEMPGMRLTFQQVQKYEKGEEPGLGIDALQIRQGA